ncbi:MAG: hypothetical protein KJ607_08270 [Bacteroidetes bacterium]|nr:hypothetical protein [Bacteroidota bacterium]
MPRVVSVHLSDNPETCMNCHIMAPQFATWNHSSHREVTGSNDCHREVPHGRVNSLSSVPYARVPLPESPVPEWLNKLMNDK